MRARAALLLVALVAGSCGREVAQVAKPGPEGANADAGQEDAGADASDDGGAEGGAGGNGPDPVAIDCSDPEDPSFELPAAAALGGDDTIQESPLILDSYQALDGPGVYVAARDGFRLYLNGELLAEETTRAPAFLPLTLLPGDNVIALVVAAADSEPAVLVHVDELTRPYVSSGDWRVNPDPEGDWRDPAYDDSSWELATELAAFGDAPGCDPTGGFPASSEARWIGSPENNEGTLVFRGHVRIEPVGYAEGTTGGAGAAPVLVSAWDELRAALADPEPAVILFPEGVTDLRDVTEVIGTCPIPCEDDPTKLTYKSLTSSETCDDALVDREVNRREELVTSNKTLVGLGRGAQLRGITLDLGESQNIIVRNIALYDVNPGIVEAGDGFHLVAPQGVWIDHCTVKWVSDGFTDVSAGTRGLTLSYLRYDGESTYACNGQHPRVSQMTGTEVTVHHSIYQRSSSRSPLMDSADSRLHFFHNLLQNNLDSGVGAACGAQVLMEGNAFENVLHPTLRTTCPGDTTLGLIDAPAGSNSYTDVGDHLGGDGMEPHDSVFTPPYDYELEPVDSAIERVRVRAGAGSIWALPLALD